jgi:hypothetical protein
MSRMNTYTPAWGRWVPSEIVSGPQETHHSLRVQGMLVFEVAFIVNDIVPFLTCLSNSSSVGPLLTSERPRTQLSPESDAREGERTIPGGIADLDVSDLL